ncbi:MAG TPA: hypothetical protein VGF45_16005, partial [Polyangia bacterium]
RIGDALAVLRATLPRDPDSAAALAPLLSRILSAPAEAAFHDEARALLLTADPARAGEVSLQATLSALAADPRDGAAITALGAAAHDRSDPSLFWWQSWHLRETGQLEAAAEALAAAAAGFAPTLPEVTQTLLARAAVLTASTDLASYAATLAVGHLDGVGSADDPAALARALLDGDRDPRGFTALFEAAAKGGNSHRLFEAAGWAVQAGGFGNALGILAAAPPEVRSSPTGARFLFRLMRLGNDPATAAALLRERAEATSDQQQNALFAHLAAESLERAGQRAEAAILYRELLAGPLAKDSDLALRRALLAQKDAQGLLDFWRDEFDASSGAGKNRNAAIACLEKARVAIDFTNRPQDAAAEVATALSLAPDLLPARVRALCQTHALTGATARLGQIEALAGVMTQQQAPQLLYLAGLLADAEGEPATGRRVFKAAMQASGGRPATALLRRHLLAEEAAGATPSEFAQALGAGAAALAKTTGADPRLGSALFLRASESAEAAGDLERTEAFIERALALEPDDLPALVRLHGLQQIRGDVAAAMRTLEIEAGVLRDPGRRAAALYAAAEIAADHLNDPARSSGFLARVLDIDPRHDGAFARQRALLEARNERVALASLLARRAQVVERAEAITLRLERVALLLGPLSDRAAAKRE